MCQGPIILSLRLLYDTLIFCSHEKGVLVANIWSLRPNKRQACVEKFTKHIMGNDNVKIPLHWDTLFPLSLTGRLWYRRQRKYLWVVRGKSAIGSYAADTQILQIDAPYFENVALQKCCSDDSSKILSMPWGNFAITIHTYLDNGVLSLFILV